MNAKEFGFYLADLREKSGFDSQRKLAIKAGISSATLSRIESGSQKPQPETLKTLSKFLKGVDYDDLMNAAGYIDKNSKNAKPDQLTEKDEHDIAKRMAKIKEDLKVAEGLSFYGEPMSEEAKESLLEAIEYAERQATRINKKFIPKKYRDKE